MLTVFIITDRDPKALTRTLSAIIGAVVDGLVREVVLLTDGANEVAAKFADDAGCKVVDLSAFAGAVQLAKCDWLMIWESGAVPELGWAENITNHIQSNDFAVRFRRSPLAARGWHSRLFRAEKPLALGLIVKKSVALALPPTALTSPQAFAKAAKPKTIWATLRPA